MSRKYYRGREVLLATAADPMSRSTIRRENLDHLIVFDEAQLRRVLKNYASYCNWVHQYQSSADSVANWSNRF